MMLLRSVLFVFLSFSIYGCSLSAVYYIDSESGCDNLSGHSADEAWASLEKVNDLTLYPGDKVLLKCGSVFNGQLLPKGVGDEDNPIEISSYGDGEKPLIAGGGRTESALKLDNVSYYEISNLEITNTGSGRKAKRYGVVVKAQNMGDCRHIYLKNLDVHHVNGSLVKSEGAGGAIYWSNGGDSVPTRFVDLRIENCHLYECGRNGITSWGNVSRKQWFPSIGVIIRGNLLEQIPGDGIVPVGCDGALIEHNVMRNCPDILSYTEAAAGIWPWSCDNTIIQHNEVSDHNAKWDGQGFDADYNCQNTLIQYNYSHDNAGGFLLICNDGNSLGCDYNIGTINTIIRYNLSVNDGIRTYPTRQAGHFAPSFHITGPCEGVSIYNNVIYIPQKSSAKIDKTLVGIGDWGGKWPSQTLFANNIFYSLDTVDFDMRGSIGHRFISNLYFGNYKQLPSDSLALFSSPQFLLDTISDVTILSPQYFRLFSSSSCYMNGVVVSDSVIMDFFGKRVDGVPSIGLSQD